MLHRPWLVISHCGSSTSPVERHSPTCRAQVGLPTRASRRLCVWWKCTLCLAFPAKYGCASTKWFRLSSTMTMEEGDGNERQHNNQQCRSEWLDQTRWKQKQHDIGGRRQCRGGMVRVQLQERRLVGDDDDGVDEHNNQILCRDGKAVGATMRQQWGGWCLLPRLSNWSQRHPPRQQCESINAQRGERNESGTHDDSGD